MANERYIEVRLTVIRRGDKSWTSNRREQALTQEGEKFVREAWGNMSMSQMCRDMGIQFATLQRFALQLGLPCTVNGKELTEEYFDKIKARKRESVKRYYMAHHDEICEYARKRMAKTRRKKGVSKKVVLRTPEEKRARANELARARRRAQSIAEGRKQYRHFNSAEEKKAFYREERLKKRKPKLTEEEKRERRREYMKAHREELNAKRRQRYADDEKFREKRLKTTGKGRGWNRKYANDEERRLARNERARKRYAEKMAKEPKKVKKPKAPVVTEVKLVKRSRKRKVLSEADKQFILDNYDRKNHTAICEALCVSQYVFNTYVDQLGLKNRDAKVTRDHSDERFKLTITRNHRVVTTVFLRNEERVEKYRKYYGDSYEYQLTAI